MELNQPHVMIFRPVPGQVGQVLTCHACSLSSDDWAIPYDDCYECPQCYTLHFAPDAIFNKWATS